MATVTSSRRRSERASGSTKVAASTPKPRRTSAKPQAGPIKPATRTSSETRNPNRVRAGFNQSNKPGAGRVTGTMGRAKPATPAPVTTSKPSGGLVNSNKPSMRQIQAKAEAARARAAGQPGIKGAIKLPNSAQRGTNLPRQGANALSTPRKPPTSTAKPGGALARIPKTLPPGVKGGAITTAAKGLGAVAERVAVPIAIGQSLNTLFNPKSEMNQRDAKILAALNKQFKGKYGDRFKNPSQGGSITKAQTVGGYKSSKAPMPKGASDALREKSYASLQKFQLPKASAPKKLAATSARSTAPKATAPKSTAPKSTAPRKSASQADTEFSGLSAADLMKGYGMRVNQTFSAESPSKPKRQSLKEQTAEIKKMIEESKKRQGKG